MAIYYYYCVNNVKKELNDSLEKEIVGFLNYNEGGELYIGIDDDGNIVGVEYSNDIQKRVVNRIKKYISFPTLMIHPFGDIPYFLI